VAAAEQMFDSLAYIRRSIANSTRVYPGHSYGKAPGQHFSALLPENIYLQFPDAASFVAFRMRRGQSWTRTLQLMAGG
jgi:hydroxyacylglutathione hydrolase